MGLNIECWNTLIRDMGANERAQEHKEQLVVWLWRASDLLSALTGIQVHPLPSAELLSAEENHDTEEFRTGVKGPTEEQVCELLESLDAVELDLEAFTNGRVRPSTVVVLVLYTEDASAPPDSLAFHLYDLGDRGSHYWQNAKDAGRSDRSYGEWFKTLKQ